MRVKNGPTFDGIKIVSMTGRVEALWLKRMMRGPMDPVTEVTLVAGKGLLGNADQGGRRQVTIFEREKWEHVMEAVQGQLSPAARRANILINGLGLANSRKCILFIGSCRIRVLGETKPCGRMEETHVGLQEAMAHGWAGGVFGEVLDDGAIRIGDVVSWESI